jgi:hypothetical protein
MSGICDCCKADQGAKLLPSLPGCAYKMSFSFTEIGHPSHKIETEVEVTLCDRHMRSILLTFKEAFDDISKMVK